MSSSTGTVVFNDSRVRAVGVIATESIGVGTSNPAATLHVHSTDSIIVPSGTTAQRSQTPVNGMLRYNSETGYFEAYTVSGWGSLMTPPSIASFTPTAVNTGGFSTITLTGSSFDENSSIKLRGSDGTEYSTTSFSFTSTTTISATLPFLPSTNSPYTVVVTTGLGLSTKSTDTLTANNNTPVWTSPAAGATVSSSSTITLSATDPDGDTLTYSIVSGTLPNGLTLSGNQISGTSTAAAGSTSTITVRASDGELYADRTFNIQTPLYAFTSHTFTNAGQTGRTGPTLTQLRNAYTPSWTDDTNYLNVVTQGIQEWTVPATGNYKFTVVGAQGGGGTSTNDRGGYSRYVIGYVNLTINETIKIAIGQAGSNLLVNNSLVGGGGGGTFVVKSNNTALLISGGGGGGGYEPYGTALGNDVKSSNYSTYQNGNDYLNNGDGGGIYPSNYNGGGGGGFNSDGTSKTATSNGEGGKGWSNGLVGGQGWRANYPRQDPGGGGFGGGGGGMVSIEVRPGAGGGYSGGEGGSYELVRVSGGGKGGGAGGNYINTSYVTSSSYGSLSTNANGSVLIELQ